MFGFHERGYGTDFASLVWKKSTNVGIKSTREVVLRENNSDKTRRHEADLQSSSQPP